MNIFAVSHDPIKAAQMLCDKHIPKMIVECFQMLGSAVRRHGAQDAQMPLTSKGTPLKGGYHQHPATRFTGETRGNYCWVVQHALELCKEYTFRFGKVHACQSGIIHLATMIHLIPEGDFTEFAQCMPDEYKRETSHQKCVNNAVIAYRNYYAGEKGGFAHWDRGRKAPDWFTRRMFLIDAGQFEPQGCGYSYAYRYEYKPAKCADS